MRVLRWIVFIVPVMLIATVLHYVLPRHEVVRIVGVTERIENLGWTASSMPRRPRGRAMRAPATSG